MHSLKSLITGENCLFQPKTPVHTASSILLVKPVPYNKEGEGMINPEIEEAKSKSIREITPMPSIMIKDEDIEPYIIIDVKKGKARIFANITKLRRVLHNKNLIQQGLDILMVDTINDFLEKMAKQEEAYEKKYKENIIKGGKYERKVWEPRTARGDAEQPGHSGAKDSTDKPT